MLELNKIYCMDCLEGMKLLDDHSIDLIQTDPPYKFQANGTGFIKKTKKKIFEKIDYAFGHDFNPLPFLQEVKRILKKMNMYVWTSKDNVPIYLNWALENGYTYHILTWHKSNPMPLWNNTYMPDTEYCIYIREQGTYFNCDLKDYRYYKKFFVTFIGEEANGHPTPKPIRVIKPSILVSCPRGGVVLDCFMGSGTTAVACKQLGFDYIGFEKEQKWIDIANKRLQQNLLTNTLENYQEALQ